MKIALCIVSVLFAGLSVIAAVSQLVKGDRSQAGASILMTAGALLLLAGALCCWMQWQGTVLNAALGCGMICAAAIRNGKQSGNFHISHHIIRIALSVLLTAGFAFLS